MRRHCTKSYLVGNPLRNLQPLKPALQRADVIEPPRQEYQPCSCIHYWLKSLQKVHRNAY